MRKKSGKVAVLNDIIVLPPKVKDIREMKVAETLIRQELKRMKQLVDAADNWAEARNRIHMQLKSYGMEGLAYL